jgi:hypothetical protein
MQKQRRIPNPPEPKLALLDATQKAFRSGILTYLLAFTYHEKPRSSSITNAATLSGLCEKQYYLVDLQPSFINFLHVLVSEREREGERERDRGEWV